MTQNAAQLLLGAGAGLVLGTMFYLGLWATVRRASRATRPWTWFVCSLVLRVAIVAAGFLLLARSGTWPLAGALVAFAAARPMVTYAVRERQERTQ